uniref:Uncharacterized protein n=1 Tax=Caenorhabditis japonica TaxID=281687 RepID=A0A8R1HR61_CAEJA
MKDKRQRIGGLAWPFPPQMAAYMLNPFAYEMWIKTAAATQFGATPGAQHATPSTPSTSSAGILPMLGIPPFMTNAATTSPSSPNSDDSSSKSKNASSDEDEPKPVNFSNSSPSSSTPSPYSTE